ncbi:MAG: glycosyltransferase family 2 protein [Flavobacteriales bacterium]|nr:glycosyltransferase family 2 protein [Flavobacteriales bacterium]
MRAVIAILNWNGQELLERFLPNVVRYAEGHPILIIDNASSDGSKDFVQESYPQVEWVQLEENHGYAGGYNRGLKHRDEDVAILLNSDVEVTEGWLSPILKAMEDDPDLVAVQPKILDLQRPEYFEYAGAAGGFMDRLNYPYCRGRLFETLEKDEGQYDTPIDVHWATGACLFFRIQEFYALGGLDEDLFAHMEEIDLCWRARRRGKRVMCIPASKVYHLGGGTLSGYRPFKSFLNFKNSLIIFLKNDRSGSTYSRLFLRMFMDNLSIVRFLFQFRGRHAFAVLKAHFFFYASLPKTLKKRKELGTAHAPLAETSVVMEYFGRGKRAFNELHASLRSSVIE